MANWTRRAQCRRASSASTTLFSTFSHTRCLRRHHRLRISREKEAEPSAITSIACPCEIRPVVPRVSLSYGAVLQAQRLANNSGCLLYSDQSALLPCLGPIFGCPLVRCADCAYPITSCVRLQIWSMKKEGDAAAKKKPKTSAAQIRVQKGTHCPYSSFPLARQADCNDLVCRHHRVGLAINHEDRVPRPGQLAPVHADHHS